MTVRRKGARPEYIEVERLLSEGWVVCQHTRAWQPPTDVYEDNAGLVVQVEIAGMRAEDFSISLAGQTLVIAGGRIDSASKQTYHQMEIRFGEFRTEVYLPWPVEPEDVEANYEDGFLKVRLLRPRAQRVPVIEMDREED
ncbi:MAG: Hsp20/alpha crystallin family protein [Chloroflexota bacterium]|nr:Hsp20/alpha crystallin family protein [Chloroflexota bacterium]